jgi:hypothetical protein
MWRWCLYQSRRFDFSHPSYLTLHERGVSGSILGVRTGIGPMKNRREVMCRCSGVACCCENIVSFCITMVDRNIRTSLCAVYDSGDKFAISGCWCHACGGVSDIGTC